MRPLYSVTKKKKAANKGPITKEMGHSLADGASVSPRISKVSDDTDLAAGAGTIRCLSHARGVKFCNSTVRSLARDDSDPQPAAPRRARRTGSAGGLRAPLWTLIRSYPGASR